MESQDTYDETLLMKDKVKVDVPGLKSGGGGKHLNPIPYLHSNWIFLLIIKYSVSSSISPSYAPHFVGA